MRDAFSRALVDAARADERVVLLTGDHGYSLFDEFRRVCPGQYLNAGVAEQNILSALLVFLLALPVIIYFARSISTPLARLSGEAQLIRSFRLDGRSTRFCAPTPGSTPAHGAGASSR